MRLKALLSTAVVAAGLAGAVPASGAAATKLLLTGDGKTVPPGSSTRWEYEVQFPGFTCFGLHVTGLGANPSRTLEFLTGEGGGESPGFYRCRYASGEEEEAGGEGFQSKLNKVTVSVGTVSQYFYTGSSIANYFADPETGCEWRLRKLSGPLPASGSLEGVHVSGVVGLERKLFPGAVCEKKASVTGVLTLETGEEATISPPYAVEAVG